MNVVRNSSIDAENTACSLIGEEKKDANKTEKLKLVRPQQYWKVVEKLKKYLSVKNEEDAVSVGFTKKGSKKKYGHYITWYSCDVTQDIGFPCLVGIATEESLVVALELRLPLFFQSECYSIPGYTMLQHLECFLAATSSKLDLEECTGPIHTPRGENINWKADRDWFARILAQYPLKYDDIYSVNVGCARIDFMCLDGEENIWLIGMSNEYLPEIIRQRLDNPYDYYLELQISKLTKREGKPFRPNLYL